MDWKEKEGKLHTHVEFKDFKEAFAFLVQVADLAEQYEHHPRIENEYNTVDLYLSTHDAGDVVTEKDHALAEAISAIQQR